MYIFNNQQLPTYIYKTNKNIQNIYFDNYNMEQIAKGPKRYDIIDDTLQIPYSIHKKIRLPNNIQGINQPIDNQIKQITKTQTFQSTDMQIHYQISQAFIKFILFYRILAYLLSLSILLSIITVYSGPQQEILILMNNVLSICIMVTCCMKLYFKYHHLKAMKLQIGCYFVIKSSFILLILIPQPTIWTITDNNHLHLILLHRFILIFNFLINYSSYCDQRAYRIIKFNGLNASDHLFFALKSIVHSLNWIQILGIYVFGAMFFTHCLFLVTEPGTKLMFMDFFQIMITTMSTVGYGEYDIVESYQKIVLFFAIVIAAILNSFITLSILKQLEMDQNQLSSYCLLKQIQAREYIEYLSKTYIQQSFSLLHSKSLKSQTTKSHINFSFKNQYKLKKNLYNNITYLDINNLFAYFRNRLIQCKIKILQTNNMISVLLTALIKYKLKSQSKQQNHPHP